jgi:hypothetical protein
MKKEEIEYKPRTVKMAIPLYQAIHKAANNSGQKCFEMFNKLLVLGAESWSKDQPPEMKINTKGMSL